MERDPSTKSQKREGEKEREEDGIKMGKEKKCSFHVKKRDVCIVYISFFAFLFSFSLLSSFSFSLLQHHSSFLLSFLSISFLFPSPPSSSFPTHSLKPPSSSPFSFYFLLFLSPTNSLPSLLPSTSFLALFSFPFPPRQDGSTAPILFLETPSTGAANALKSPPITHEQLQQLGDTPCTATHTHAQRY